MVAPHAQLFQWCAQDARCAAAYHIDGAAAQDEHVFRYLSSKWLPPRVDLMQPLNDTVCGSESFGTLLRDTWLLEMRLQSHENARVQCGNNERFIFSIETMEGHCVCLEDRNCEGGGNYRSNALTYSTISIVVVSVVMAIVLLLYMCTLYQKMRVYQRLMFRCQRKCGADTQKEFQKNI